MMKTMDIVIPKYLTCNAGEINPFALSSMVIGGIFFTVSHS